MAAPALTPRQEIIDSARKALCTERPDDMTLHSCALSLFTILKESSDNQNKSQVISSSREVIELNREVIEKISNNNLKNPLLSVLHSFINIFSQA